MPRFWKYSVSEKVINFHMLANAKVIIPHQNAACFWTAHTRWKYHFYSNNCPREFSYQFKPESYMWSQQLNLRVGEINVLLEVKSILKRVRKTKSIPVEFNQASCLILFGWKVEHCNILACSHHYRGCLLWNKELWGLPSCTSLEKEDKTQRFHTFLMTSKNGIFYK